MSDNRKAFEDEVQSFVSSQPEWRYADTEALWWFFWQAATEQSSKEIERLNALVAMQAEALKHAQKQPHPFGHLELFEKALSASSETVEAWKAKMLLPLQRQVAMLNDLLKNIDRSYNDGAWIDWTPIIKAINYTQVTAEAYDREHAAKVFDKVIKFGASEREARLVFANTQDRDNFLALVIGAADLRATKQVKE